MAAIDVGAYISQLREKLPYVPPVPVRAIKSLHKKRDFGGIVRLIRKTMNVGVNLTVHWTSDARHDKTPAWIEIPQKSRTTALLNLKI